jgi:hypothetical protein
MTVALPQDTDVRHGDRRAAAQVGEWFRTWQATGDPAIRERIILAHLGMAERLATRFRHTRDVGHDDLVQAARVGLVAAVDRFEPNRGNSFIGYAVVCITGELRRCLRDTCWQVHVPRTLKERALQVVRARDALTVMLERSPTLAEIAGRLAITEEHVAGALEAIGTRCRWSLDEPSGVDATTSLGRCCPPRPVRSSWRIGWHCLGCWPGCPSWSGGRSCCGSTATSSSTRSGRCWAAPRCTSRGCCEAPCAACAGSSSPDCLTASGRAARKATGGWHGPRITDYPIGGGGHRRRGQPACRGPGETQQIEVVLDIDADGASTSSPATGKPARSSRPRSPENSNFDRIEKEVIPKQAARAHVGAPQEVVA